MRRLAFFTLVMMVAMLVNAQAPQEHIMAVGGKAGMTLSRLNFSPTVPQTMSPGVTAGVMFRYIAEKNFGLVGEFNVVQRGWKEVFEESDYQYSRKFTYLELPILTHIYFGGKRIKGFFNLGPELNVMLADGISSNFDYREAPDLEYFNYNTRRIEQLTMDVNNRLDYGICIGAGMELNLNVKHSLLLEGRFYYGLTDVFPNHKIDVFSASNPMSVIVTLGYFCNLTH